MRGLRETVPRRRLKSLLVLSVLAFSAAVASLSHGAAAESLGGWTSTTAYGGGALDRSSCAYYAGYIYCVGGYDGSNATSTVEYAPVSASGVGTWTSTTAYGGGAVQDQSCAIYAGYIYCVGGIVAGSDSSAVWYASVSSSGVGAWTSTTAYGAGVVTGTSCFTSSGDLFCVGGVVGTSLSSAVYYAPVSSSGVGTWTSTTAYAAGTVTAESCVPSSSYVYCVGGLVGGGSGSISSDVYYASVSSSGVGAWTATTAYGGGTVRTESCSTSSGYIYCVGGYDGTSVVSQVYYAQVSSSGVGAWNPTTAYGGGTIEDQSCAAASGYLYCVAGFTGTAVTSEVYYAPFFVGVPSVTTGSVQADTGTTAVVNCQSAMDVGFGQNLPAAEIESMGTQVNFTDAALGGATNPAQTFGVGCDSSNPAPQAANVTTISGSAITLTLSDAANQFAYTILYHLQGTTIYSVTINSGTSSDTIPDTSYVANQGTLSTCAAPCVYDSGSYTEVKAVYVAPTTLTFSLTAAPSSNGGGGGSPPPSTPPITCPTGDVYNTTTGACQTAKPTSYSAPIFGNDTQIVTGFAVVGALILLVAARIASGDKSKTGHRKGSQPKVKKGKLPW